MYGLLQEAARTLNLAVHYAFYAVYELVKRLYSGKGTRICRHGSSPILWNGLEKIVSLETYIKSYHPKLMFSVSIRSILYFKLSQIEYFKDHGAIRPGDCRLLQAGIYTRHSQRKDII